MPSSQCSMNMGCLGGGPHGASYLGGHELCGRPRWGACCQRRPAGNPCGEGPSAKAEDGEKPHKTPPFLTQNSPQEGPSPPCPRPANRTGCIRRIHKPSRQKGSFQYRKPSPMQVRIFPGVGPWPSQGRSSFCCLRSQAAAAGRWVLPAPCEWTLGRLCLFWLAGSGGNTGWSQAWERGRNSGG